MNLFKKMLSLLLAVVMFAAVCAADGVFANGLRQTNAAVDPRDPEMTDSDFDGIPDIYDAYPNGNTFSGAMKSGHDGTTKVTYTMDLRSFFDSNTVYHPDIATVSVIGSALAYYTANPVETYVTFDSAQTWAGGTATTFDGVQLMQLHGFEDVVDFTLDSYGDDDICEMIIGHKAVSYNGVTKVIIAIWVRGTEPTSMEEWSSNFNVGDLVRFFDAYDSVEGKYPRQSNDDWTRKTNHRGFDVCATRLLRYLKDYYLDEYVEPVLAAIPEATVAYWLAGHSRGGSVANLMASYLVDEGEEVFAYTFASPFNTANTEASAEKYDCIFNLVNANDFVPTLPMPEWGFTRFGKTACVESSQWATEIKNATGVDYDGKYLTASDINTMLGKFICITGENADRDNPGKILGWREVYVYHCGHNHSGETNGNYQSSTVRAWGIFGPYENDYYNKYPIRLQKYSYWEGGICQTPAYCMQVLVELMVAVANGEYLSGGWTYLTSNKLADKFDFNKQSLVSYASKLTEPHFMDTYSVIQAQINLAGNPGARFATMQYYTAENAAGGRPIHTHTYTYVPYEGHEPTCTEAGLGYRYCKCSDVNPDYYDDYQKNVTIPALGHEWGEPEYAWNADHSECTATRVCLRDASHAETETVASVYTVIAEPTYAAPGIGRYVADFASEAFETQYYDVEIPMLQGFTVTFVDWDGTVIDTQTVEHGSAAAAPAVPTRVGYTFIGWDVDFSNVQSDLVVTAQYTINTYTVTFKDWDGRVIMTQTVAYGEAAAAPADPAREGYTFIGWDVDFSNVTSNLTVTAQYEENEIPSDYLKGDVNCDGFVDTRDLALAAAIAMNAGSTSAQGVINGDMNGDGLLNSSDLSSLAAYIGG